jgi:hypothetical protein
MDTLFKAFFYAYFFWFSVSAGCFALLLIHHAIRGAWALPFQRVLEAGTKSFIVMMPLFLVLMAGLPHLYAWANPIPATDHVLQHKAAYLNVTGFLIRTLVTFAIWGFFAFVLIRSTQRQEKSLDAREADYRANWAAPGIVLFMLTATMTYTDWVMSRDAHWFSTIYPALLVVGQALAAISFSILFVTGKKRQDPYAKVLTPKLTRDMGNLMLALTMLWAYFTFSQYVIIWSGNLPEETGYFHSRTTPAWNWIGFTAVICQFFAPFLLLLSGRTKRTPEIIRQVAALVLFARVVDLYWNIAPFTVGHGHTPSPADFALPFAAAFVVVGLIWLATFEFFRRQASPLPSYDPRLEFVGAGGGHHG